MDERCEHAGDQTHGREHHNLGMKSRNGTRVRCTKLRREVPDNEGTGGRSARRVRQRNDSGRPLKSLAVKQ